MMRLFIFLIFLNSYASFAGDRTIDDLLLANSSGDTREALSAAADMIRANDKRSASVLVPTQVEQGVCVECTHMLEFVALVEDVLKSTGDAPQEVEELAVVSTYMRFINKEGQPDCFHYKDPNWSDEFRGVDLESAIVLFEGEFDLDRLRSWRVTGGALPGPGLPGDTVFLRGRGDDHNLFVRLDLAKEPGADPRVTLYKLQNVRPDLAETPREKIERDNPLPKLGNPPSWKPSWTEDGEYDGSLNLSLNNETVFRVGPVLEMKNYLPKKLTLMEFKTAKQLNDSNNLVVTGEVSTRRQEAKFKIVGRHGEGEKVWLRVKDDGDYEVGIPYGIMLSGMPVRGGLIANDKGGGASVVVNETGEYSTEARYFNSRGVSSYEFDHRRKLSDKSSITFRVAREDGQENVWLLFRYSLD